MLTTEFKRLIAGSLNGKLTAENILAVLMMRPGSTLAVPFTAKISSAWSILEVVSLVKVFSILYMVRTLGGFRPPLPKKDKACHPLQATTHQWALSLRAHGTLRSFQALLSQRSAPDLREFCLKFHRFL